MPSPILPPRPPPPPGASLDAPALDVSVHGSARVRSRVLGREEHDVMLALGLVRAAARALAGLEPQLLRACDLADRLGTPAETTATRGELSGLVGALSAAVTAAVSGDQPLLEGGSVTFDVDDTRKDRIPVTVRFPNLAPLVQAENGLSRLGLQRRGQGDAGALAGALRAAVAAGRDSLRDAEQQLAVLLAHFHRQRVPETGRPPVDSDLPERAARLRERLLRAGPAALAAQGALSARASSLVLEP